MINEMYTDLKKHRIDESSKHNHSISKVEEDYFGGLKKHLNENKGLTEYEGSLTTDTAYNRHKDIIKKFNDIDSIEMPDDNDPRFTVMGILDLYKTGPASFEEMMDILDKIKGAKDLFKNSLDCRDKANLISGIVRKQDFKTFDKYSSDLCIDEWVERRCSLISLILQGKFRGDHKKYIFKKHKPDIDELIEYANVDNMLDIIRNCSSFSFDDNKDGFDHRNVIIYLKEYGYLEKAPILKKLWKQKINIIMDMLYSLEDEFGKDVFEELGIKDSLPKNKKRAIAYIEDINK